MLDLSLLRLYQLQPCGQLDLFLGLGPVHLKILPREYSSKLVGIVGDRPANLPARETRKDIEAEIERFDQQSNRKDPTRLGGVALAGSPKSVHRYLEEYIETGANYFVCSFQWGDIDHQTAMNSINLFSEHILPQYM